jgi:hypothetical protein
LQPLAAGQSMKLPDGLGTVTYLGYQQWISLAITYDPGQLPALASGVAALAGLILSFLVRRRRVFVRASTADGGSEVWLGGLARSDAAGGFETEFGELAEQLRAKLAAAPTAATASAPAANGIADIAPVSADRQQAALTSHAGSSGPVESGVSPGSAVSPRASTDGE